MAKNTNEVAQYQSTLIGLAKEAAEISRLLLDAEGELSPELESRLDVSSQALTQKVDHYSFVLKEMELRAGQFKAQKDAAAAIQKRIEAQVERMKERIKLAMKEMDAAEVSGNLSRFQLRKSAPRLVVDDESKVPGSFKMQVTKTILDTERMKLALIEGFEVPGAHIEQSGSLYQLNAAGKE